MNCTFEIDMLHLFKLRQKNFHRSRPLSYSIGSNAVTGHHTPLITFHYKSTTLLNKKFELMLTRCTIAYSSCGSVV